MIFIPFWKSALNVSNSFLLRIVHVFDDSRRIAKRFGKYEYLQRMKIVI